MTNTPQLYQPWQKEVLAKIKAIKDINLMSFDEFNTLKKHSSAKERDRRIRKIIEDAGLSEHIKFPSYTPKNNGLAGYKITGVVINEFKDLVP